MNTQKKAAMNLREAIQGIPGAEEIYDAATSDWIRNIGTEDLDTFEVEHMKEAVGYLFEKGKVPDISEDNYKKITNAFKQFVREYYGAAGGKRKSKKTRKHKKRSKKTRKH